MAYRVLINGAHGRMGRLADQVISNLAGFEIIARCGHNDNLSQQIREQHIDIVIDFTTAEVVYQNTLTILQAGARPIIGTSGLQAAQVQQLQDIALLQNLAGVIVPNFSLAAVLMMRFAKMAAPYFKQAEIIELHHEKKLDAPSGTAIRTAELLQLNHPQTSWQCKETLVGARGASLNHVPIHSIRLPGILAKQQVILGENGETLTIEYNTLNYQAYSAGIALACQKVMALSHLEYGLENLMEFDYEK